MTFVNISKSKDPRKEFLPYLTGFDRYRHKNHGKLKIFVTKAYVEIFSKRRINRYTDKLVIQLFDFEYGQKSLIEKDRRERTGNPVLLQHSLCFRSVTVERDPIKQFETAIFNLPLIELQVFTNYNNGNTMNHYLH